MTAVAALVQPPRGVAGKAGEGDQGASRRSSR